MSMLICWHKEADASLLLVFGKIYYCNNQSLPIGNFSYVRGVFETQPFRLKRPSTVLVRGLYRIKYEQSFKACRN